MKNKVANYHPRALVVLLPILFIWALPSVVLDFLPALQYERLIRILLYMTFFGIGIFTLRWIDSQVVSGKFKWMRKKPNKAIDATP